MSNEANKPSGLELIARLAQPASFPALSFAPIPIDRRVYKNVQVDLDGYTFRNCAFINCQLTTSKSNFQLEDCHIQNCQLLFGGNSLKAVRLSSLLLGNWDHLPVELRARIEADWGITIQ